LLLPALTKTQERDFETPFCAFKDKIVVERYGISMHSNKEIIGKRKVRRIRRLEILWLDAGHAPGGVAFPAVFANEDGD